jgi:hypothetical protein
MKEMRSYIVKFLCSVYHSSLLLNISTFHIEFLHTYGHTLYKTAIRLQLQIELNMCTYFFFLKKELI